MSAHSAYRALVLLLVAVASSATAAFAQTGPVIRLEHGTTQSFGAVGHPQRWVNVLGHVEDPDVVASLSMTLNGGTPEPLSIGPDQRRLYDPGEFNAEIDRLLLRDGANTLVLTARDVQGNLSTRTVTIQYSAATRWPRSTSVDWARQTAPEDAVWVVDGSWRLTSDGLRTEQVAYDRAFALGELDWPGDYEVTVPITLHRVDPAGFGGVSGSPGFGFTTRWIGHSRRTDEQPRIEWRPQGGGPWYDAGFDRLRLLGWDGMTVDDPADRRIPVGVRNWWKLRVETEPDGTSTYRFKMWPDGQSEPAGWDFAGSEGIEDLTRGGVLFVAHHCDVTFGNITVRPVGDDLTPPDLTRAVTLHPTTDAVTAVWDTDDVATGSLRVGTTTVFENGEVHVPGRRAEHRVRFPGLLPDTPYVLQAVSTDWNGNVRRSPVLPFRTLAAEPPLGGDTFDAPLDRSVWRFVDQFGTATATAGNNGQLLLSLPNDASRLGMRGVRLTRPTQDVDFTVEAVFQSALDLDTKMFGFVVEQDVDDYVLFDLRFFRGSHGVVVETVTAGVDVVPVNEDLTDPALAAGTLPIIVRLERSGNRWTFSYSTDGRATYAVVASVEHRLAARRVGLMVGNENVPFDARVDEFVVLPPDTTAPSVSDLRIARAGTRAMVTWNTDEPADSAVLYGAPGRRDAYRGGAVPRTRHAVEVDGLVPDTGYELEVESSDSAGNVGRSGVVAFRSGVAANRAGIASDDFQGASLDPLWEVEDPLGGATVGLGPQGGLRIATSGAARDMFARNTSSARVMQPCLDDDLDVAVRFTSSVDQDFQSQGLLFEQDFATGNFLRAEIHNLRGRRELYVVTVQRDRPSIRVKTRLPSSLPTPHWLRVERAADLWTVSWSADGVAWRDAASFEHPMRVLRTGIFSGHSAGIGHTLEADRFVDLAAPPPDTTAPVVDGLQVAANDGTVRVSWQTDELADALLELGTTTAYGRLVQRASLATAHELEITGLQPDTVYHFRVASRDAAGNRTVTADRTVTTARTGNRSGLRTDLFGDPAASMARWRLVDPTGDAVDVFDGQTAGIDLSGAVAHDAWTKGNTLARLVQPVFDEDLGVRVEFASDVTASNQVQGVYFEESPSRILRCEFHYVGGSKRLFVATVVDGLPQIQALQGVSVSPPMFLRVARVGREWTVEGSDDGQSWLEVARFGWDVRLSRVGLYAGNSVGTPFQLRADAFLAEGDLPPDTMPPGVSDFEVAAADQRMVVRWRTDEPAFGRLEVGTTPRYGTTVDGRTATTLHELEVGSLAPDTVHHFRITSTDLSSNATVSQDMTVRTAPLGNATGLRSDAFDDPVTSSARWRLVDPVMDSTVNYTGSEAVLAASGRATHEAWNGFNSLARLVQPAVDGDFEVEANFTSRPDRTVQVQGIYVEQSDDTLLRAEVHFVGRARVFVATIDRSVPTVRGFVDIPAVDPTGIRVGRRGDRFQVDYRLPGSGSTWQTAAVFDWVVRVRRVGLYLSNAAGVPFTLRAGDFTVAGPPGADTTPPVVSGIDAVPSDEAVLVTWSTDEPATSLLEVGTASGTYTLSAADPSPRTAHRLLLPGLTPSSNWHFRVVSVDPSGNRAETPDATFSTLASGFDAGAVPDPMDGALAPGLWRVTDVTNSLVIGSAGPTAVRLALPAGVAHDAWINGITVPRLAQAIHDEDLDVSARYATLPTVDNTTQGLFATAADGTFVRVELVNQGGLVRLLVASIRSGNFQIHGLTDLPGASGPLELRLRRSGDNFEVLTSPDGSSWTTRSTFSEVLELRSTGVYVGNPGGAGHSVDIESFDVRTTS